jgi:hypothetical protein
MADIFTVEQVSHRRQGHPVLTRSAMPLQPA